MEEMLGKMTPEIKLPTRVFFADFKPGCLAHCGGYDVTGLIFCRRHQWCQGAQSFRYLVCPSLGMEAEHRIGGVDLEKATPGGKS